MSKPVGKSNNKDAVLSDNGEQGAGLLGGLARRLAHRALHDPRVQEAAVGLRRGAENLRTGVLSRADERLETLIEQRGQGAPSEEVGEALTQRRRERVGRSAKLRAYASVLAVAMTTQERRVLLRVLEGTSWAGGERELPKYTALLDSLAPEGDAGHEMTVHRAIWSLAEREVLSVSPHGVVSAVPLTSYLLEAEAAKVLKNGMTDAANTSDHRPKR